IGFRTTWWDFSFAISDNLSEGAAKHISEVVSIAVSMNKGAGKFPLLSVVPSDVVGRVFTGFRTTSWDLSSAISDVVTKGAAKSMSEVVSIAVSLNKGAGKFPLLSVVPSDVVGRVFTGARAISENSVSAVSDSVTKLFHGFRGTAESLASALSDSINKGAGKFPLLSVVPSDAAGRVFTGARAISENSVSAMSDRVTPVFH